MYGSLVALAVFVLSATFILDHGGESIAAVQSVTVHDLTMSPNNWDGSPISVDGTLGYSEEHDEYQLVDEEASYAVLVRKHHVSTALAELVGKQVRVSGVFGIDDDLGVYIDADAIQLSPAPE
jgi:hypothetical protein